MNMKIKILGLLAALALVFVPRFALAESVTSFDSYIVINDDSSIAVKETILYNFGTSQRHGIIRDLPYKYQTNKGNMEVRISRISVTDETGKPYKFSVSTAGDFKEIKIGDENVYVTGIRPYNIYYTAEPVIGFFEDHDELYWNAMGNAWDVNIDKASATIKLPGILSLPQLQIGCTQGPYGSTETCQEHVWLGEDADQIQSVRFGQSGLGPNEGMTFVVGFPKGLVHKNPWWKTALYALEDNWILGLPVAVFFLLFYIWRKKGRDPKGYETVVAQYEAPDNLTPAEVGTIVDESADNVDVSAEIIYLATKGYIKITRIENKVLIFKSTDYQLDRLKDPKDLENAFDRRLMEGLFGGLQNTAALGDLKEGFDKLTQALHGGTPLPENSADSKLAETLNLSLKSSVKLSELKKNFHHDLRAIKAGIYTAAVAKGYFAKNPQTVRNIYITIGVVIIIAAVKIIARMGGVYYAASFLATGVLFLVFAKFMAARTAKGAQARQHILGLKLYLSVAEKDRLEFHNAPEKSPERFEKLLPYAMALKVENQWAKQFEGMYIQPPSWYADPAGSQFSTMLFVNSMHSFSASANTAMAAQARGGGGTAWGGGSGIGGGFSGGGFGGGGGRSW